MPLVEANVYQVEDNIITCLKNTSVETVLYHFLTSCPPLQIPELNPEMLLLRDKWLLIKMCS